MELKSTEDISGTRRRLVLYKNNKSLGYIRQIRSAYSRLGCYKVGENSINACAGFLYKDC